MKVLVLGATGTVGSLVTANLVKAGASVSALTRSAEKAAALPAGVEARIGDLSQPFEVGEAFKGVDAVFLLNAMSPSETQEGLFALSWAKTHGVKKLVYLSVLGAEQWPHLPHFASKLGMEQAIKASGIDYTILQPSSFYQNDLWAKDAILQHGVYPTPLGSAGVDRVDVRDIAEAAVKALLGKRRNRTFAVAGPTSETGASTAAAWSKHLGRPIAYAGDDLEAWAQASRMFLPEWMVFDLKLMFTVFQKHGFRATPVERASTERLIGHPMRTFDAFVQETAAQWQG